MACPTYNPLSRYRVTHNGQTFTVTATSKAAAERQVRAMGIGEGVEDTGKGPGSRNPWGLRPLPERCAA